MKTRSEIGKHEWECPKCGETNDHSSVVCICGYKEEPEQLNDAVQTARLQQSEPENRKKDKEILLRTIARIAIKAIAAMIGSLLITIIFFILYFYTTDSFYFSKMALPPPGEQDLGMGLEMIRWLISNDYAWMNFLDNYYNSFVCID